MSTKSDKTIRKIVVGASIGAALLLGGCGNNETSDLDKAENKAIEQKQIFKKEIKELHDIEREIAQEEAKNCIVLNRYAYCEEDKEKWPIALPVTE